MKIHSACIYIYTYGMNVHLATTKSALRTTHMNSEIQTKLTKFKSSVNHGSRCQLTYIVKIYVYRVMLKKTLRL